MSKFKILVKTSDRFGAGTDSDVYVRLIDKHGRESKPLNLDAFFRNDFERDHLNDFIEKTEKLDDITDIEVWRDSGVLLADWHLEYISVEDLRNNRKVIFPFYRWVLASKHYFIEAYDSSLPQNAKYYADREEELREKRALYQYKINFPNMPVEIKDLPEDENFSVDYKWDLTMRRISQSIVKVWVSVLHDKKAYFKSLDDVFKVFGYYSNMPIPEDAEHWREDSYFGHQRLNGCNPKLIQLCYEIPESFKVDSEVLKPLLEGKTVQDAIKAKKLFIIDITSNEGISTKNGAVLTSPYCLLYLKDNDDLVPVAIQLFKTSAPDNPVFYASDDQNLWILAKMWYCLADANYHQGALHLGGAHIVMEGFCVSMNRNLSPSHPVYKLLEPHFLFLLPINFRAVKSLLGEGGYVDNSMAVGHIGLSELVAKHHGHPDVFNSDLVNDLKRRGVYDDDILPNYHYRDDAKLVYGIIQNYVAKMIRLFYKTEHDLINDKELQNWGKEIVAPKPEGQGCINVPGGGRFTTHVQLISLVTYIISTCSIEHSAFNFSMYDSYAIPPAYPTKLRGEPPKNKDPVTEDDIVKALCNKEHMMTNLMVAKYLSMRGTKSLGDFEVVYLYQPEALEMAEEFREELKKASDIVTERDQQRRIPYEILNAAVIPNSISI